MDTLTTSSTCLKMSPHLLTLPRHPSNLDVLFVRMAVAQSHKDFRVRKRKVLSALKWLIANNPYYRNIILDEDALQALPEDGDVSSHFTSAQYIPSDENMQDADVQMSEDAQTSRTLLPVGAGHCLTEEETVRQTIDKRAVPWPSRNSSSPVSEFTTEGYMSCAFPTLYPTGATDFLAPRDIRVTPGNYFKHLTMYHDGKFARHAHFRYFALNSEMRWRALECGKIYVRHHHDAATLSVTELRDMIGREGEAFSNRVLHFAATLRGTSSGREAISFPWWTILDCRLYTLSAADMQWPELARLICPEEASLRAKRNSAVIANPAIADWFFYHRVVEFMKAFFVDILGAEDYWLRFEWQHRGSPHVHGLAWLRGAPNQDQMHDPSDGVTLTDHFVNYVDELISSRNPAVLPDGSNVDSAPLPFTTPHVCNKSYMEVKDYEQDLIQLVATCQRHTRCSAAYCLKVKRGRQEYRFGYPKPLQQQTTVVVENEEKKLLTARNDSLVNNYNPTQLSAWRACSTAFQGRRCHQV